MDRQKDGHLAHGEYTLALQQHVKIVKMFKKLQNQSEMKWHIFMAHGIVWLMV